LVVGVIVVGAVVSSALNRDGESGGAETDLPSRTERSGIVAPVATRSPTLIRPTATGVPRTVVRTPSLPTATAVPVIATPTTQVLAESGYFTFGSHKDDVIRLHGTPTDVLPSINVWYYGLSSVDFDSSDRIVGWSNSANNLRVQATP